MAGSSRCIEVHMFAGLRVGSVDYTPAYNKNGRNVSQKSDIHCYRNIASSANDGKGRNEPVELTAWGKLADTCCKSCSPGKELHIIGDMHVYDKRCYMPTGVPNTPGQLLVKPDGNPLTTKATSFTITRLIFGEESDKFVGEEITRKIRPIGWNQKGSQDNLNWIAILKARQAIQFDPTKPTFGYARVRKVEGPGISAYNPALDLQRGNVQTVATTAPAQPQFATPAIEQTVVNAAGNPGVVANVMTQPIVDPAATFVQPSGV